ncbi:MAG: hypothetical protein ACRC8S_02340 [Fimbriiglobus sp.]
MVWAVGIDEAGYGPILGPLVQVAVALRLPDNDPGGYTTLAPWIARHAEKDKKRLTVDDSKLVNSGKYGLQKLEAGLVGMLGLTQPTTLGDWLHEFAVPYVVDELENEAWYDKAMSLPLFEHKTRDLREPLAKLDIETKLLGISVTPAPLFNRIVAGSGTKSTVIGLGLSNLLRAIRHRLEDFEPVEVLCDKQGGRSFYGPLMQSAFSEGWVVTEHESPTESRYRIESLGRDVRVTFRPRAEAESAAVALASMTAKYLREVTMMQFNAYWQKHHPDIKPTAGYPTDGERFYATILPTLTSLNLTPDDVRRSK